MKDEFSLKRLSLRKSPFDLFKKIYNEYDMVFILESLTGPPELSQYSIIGFDPVMRIECDYKKFRVTNKEGVLVHESDVNDPVEQLRRMMPKVTTNKYRFIGGAVGYVSYDALRFWESLSTRRKKALEISFQFSHLGYIQMDYYLIGSIEKPIIFMWGRIPE